MKSNQTSAIGANMQQVVRSYRNNEKGSPVTDACLNCNKTHKVIRIDTEREQVESISNRIEVANFQRSSRKAKRELRINY